jgi:hypothetical protein
MRECSFMNVKQDIIFRGTFLRWPMAKQNSGTPWQRADLLFLLDAHDRGLPLSIIAGFLGRTKDEVRAKCRTSGRYFSEGAGSSGVSGGPQLRANDNHRRSTSRRSAFSASPTPGPSAIRRASLARR